MYITYWDITTNTAYVRSIRVFQNFIIGLLCNTVVVLLSEQPVTKLWGTS